jgi:hypothetical protein
MVWVVRFIYQILRHHIAPQYTQSDEVRNSGPSSLEGLMLILPNKPIHVKTQNAYSLG